MYVPDVFRIRDEETILRFIHDNGFATVISKGAEYPLATHIPLEIDRDMDGNLTLTGHISNANPQSKDILSDTPVLAIFQSPIQGYISSSWYGHPNAPTWNYLSVQAVGLASVMNEERLWETVGKLTDRYEGDQLHPVSLQTMPPEVLKQMKMITGIEIKVHKIDASFKLSQNRNEKDFLNVLKELRQKKDWLSMALADVMERQ